MLATDGLRLTPGTQLGPYKIEGPLGQGGMGEVYRARDPRLNRDVAIKVSAARFSERFEREAKGTLKTLKRRIYSHQPKSLCLKASAQGGREFREIKRPGFQLFVDFR